jgi:hypothetical protein
MVAQPGGGLLYNIISYQRQGARVSDCAAGGHLALQLLLDHKVIFSARTLLGARLLMNLFD